MNLRTPLSQVRGLGSAKEGVSHWWWQRLTAVALVPLTLWFVISVIAHMGADYEAMRAWVGSPSVAVTMVLLIAATFYHLKLGAQVVIEDYVHHGATKLVALVLLNFATNLKKKVKREFINERQGY